MPKNVFSLLQGPGKHIHVFLRDMRPDCGVPDIISPCHDPSELTLRHLQPLYITLNC